MRDDIPEDKLVFVGLEPAQLGDSGEQLNQRLGDERRQFGSRSQVVEDVIPYIYSLMKR